MPVLGQDPTGKAARYLLGSLREAHPKKSQTGTSSFIRKRKAPRVNVGRNQKEIESNMANTNRKARKSAGEKFVRVAKVGTPVQERSWFAALLPSIDLLKNPAPRRRSEKARRRALADRGIAWVEDEK